MRITNEGNKNLIFTKKNFTEKFLGFSSPSRNILRTLLTQNFHKKCFNYLPANNFIR